MRTRDSIVYNDLCDKKLVNYINYKYFFYSVIIFLRYTYRVRRMRGEISKKPFSSGFLSLLSLISKHRFGYQTFYFMENHGITSGGIINVY